VRWRDWEGSVGVRSEFTLDLFGMRKRIEKADRSRERGGEETTWSWLPERRAR
jgi:hypothetical protein